MAWRQIVGACAVLGGLVTLAALLPGVLAGLAGAPAPLAGDIVVAPSATDWIRQQVQPDRAATGRVQATTLWPQLGGAPSGRLALTAACGGIVPGRVLVRFADHVAEDARHALLHSVGATKQSELRGIGVWIAGVAEGRETAVSAALSAAPGVEFAEPDSLLCMAEPEQPVTAAGGSSHHVATPDDRIRPALDPNDPDFREQWGLRAVRAPEAWDVTTGASEIHVAVLDSGLFLQHPDKPQNLVTGKNYLDPDRGLPTEDHGHGTHVTGIVAARTNNREGIAGVAPGATVVAVKVANRAGRVVPDSELADAITFAVDTATQRNGHTIINMSLGGFVPLRASCAAVDFALTNGALVVAATGNHGLPFVSHPAACPGALGVGATGPDDVRAAFSNYGYGLAIVAPGEDILSTWWPDASAPTVCQGRNYCVLDGTSMATPFVSGVAALVWSANRALKAEGVGVVLLATARDLGREGPDLEYGAGVVDAYAAVSIAKQLGSAPLLIAGVNARDATTATVRTAFAPGDRLSLSVRWFSVEDFPVIASVDVLDERGQKVGALSCSPTSLSSGLGWGEATCSRTVPADQALGGYTLKTRLTSERSASVFFEGTGPLTIGAPDVPGVRATPAQAGPTRLYLPSIFKR